MAVKIRLKRMGATKRPYYRLVVADSRAKRDGNVIESIGTYMPLEAEKFNINTIGHIGVTSLEVRSGNNRINDVEILDGIGNTSHCQHSLTFSANFLIDQTHKTMHNEFCNLAHTWFIRINTIFA